MLSVKVVDSDIHKHSSAVHTYADCGCHLRGLRMNFWIDHRGHRYSFVRLLDTALLCLVDAAVAVAGY